MLVYVTVCSSVCMIRVVVLNEDINLSKNKCFRQIAEECPTFKKEKKMTKVRSLLCVLTFAAGEEPI